MPRLPAVLLSVVLAAVLHLDWHLPRPVHHRLSLGWPHHWLATAVAFAIAGWLIARRWPARRWELGGAVYVAAVVLAQIAEPALEVLFHEGRLGYSVESERWAAFWSRDGGGDTGLLGRAMGLRAATIGAPRQLTCVAGWRWYGRERSGRRRTIIAVERRRQTAPTLENEHQALRGRRHDHARRVQQGW